MFLLVAVKLITSAQSYAAQPSFYDSIMKYYMTTLEGEWNEEKSAYISEIRNEIDSKIGGWEAIEEKYRAHEITYDEYIQCRTEYEDAKAKNEPFREVEKRDLYLRERSESGLKAEFVYDTGYNKLFFSPFDIILLVLLAALLSGVFARRIFIGLYSHSSFHSERTPSCIRSKTCGITFNMPALLYRIFDNRFCQSAKQLSPAIRVVLPCVYAAF